jgi:hypothetical protein
MSQHPKPTTSSSLSSLSKPAGSPPVSPSLLSLQTSKTVSSIDSTLNMNNSIEQRLNAFEVAQQKSTSDINRLTSMMENFFLSQSSMTTKVDDRIHLDSDEIQNQQIGNIQQKQTTVGSNPTTHQPKKFVQNETLLNRDAVKDRSMEASKSLFGLSIDKHDAIEQYASSKQTNMINQSFNLNESTIVDMNETKLLSSSDYVSNSTHTQNSNNNNNTNNNFSFIQSLMPTAAVVGQPTLTDLLQSGIKVASTMNDKNKIKDVHKLVELLTEQAKAIVKASSNSTVVEHDSSTCAASDFLIYTLQLMKLLFEYGLHATLEYHFALLKRVHAGECLLKGEHPMLMFEIFSKYKRLHHEKLLHSSLIHSSNNYSNSSSYSNNKQQSSSGRKSTPKFTGTPCTYHTRVLGRPANHSDEQCRVPKQNK